MIELLIFDTSEKQIGTFTHYTDEKVVEALDNKSTFSFTVPLEEENAKEYFTVGNKIGFQLDSQYKLFCIASIEDTSSSIGVPIRKVDCEGIHYELLYNLVSFSYTGTNLSTVFNDAIDGSDWTLSIDGVIAIPTDLDDNPLHAFTLQNSYKVLKDLAAKWQCDVYFTATVTAGVITDKTVHVIQARGTAREQVYTFSNAIESLKKTVDYTGIVNRMYAKGAVTGKVNNLETYVNIADVLWQTPNNPVNKPVGQNFFEDAESIEAYGLKEGVSEHNTDDLYYLSMSTYRDLLDKRNPKASFEISLVDLYRLDDDVNFYVALGDTINVYDTDLNLNVDVRISGIEYNPNDATTTKFTLDNYIDLWDVDTVARLKKDTATNANPPFVNDWNSNQPVDGDDTIVVVKAAYKGTSGEVYIGYDAKGNQATALTAYNGNTKTVEITADGDATFTGTVEASTINGGTINGTEINGTTINGTTINGAEINSPDILIGDEAHQRMHIHANEGVPFLDVYDASGAKTLSIYQQGLSFLNKSNFVSHTVGNRTGIGIFTI